MVFPVVMYGCESWTIKKAEHWRIDAFELGAGEDSCEFLGLQGDPTSPSISLGCSLEGLMLKLKLQNFGYLMWRADSFEKTLMLGKIECRRRRGQQRMRWLDGITDSMDMSMGKLRELVIDKRPGVLRFMGSQRVGQTEWLNWTELNEQFENEIKERVPFTKKS